MASTVSIRVEDDVKIGIEHFWKAHGLGTSAGLRRAVEEWWAIQQFPEILFRDGVSGRRAALREGPDVWEVIEVARGYDNDLDRLEEHFGGHLSRAALVDALRYADVYRGEIEQWMMENRRVGQLIEAGLR
ncbi:MAG TPA: hypothetical protein VNU46_05720 [Gemmatimonadaceae bacterium]|jgi:hypothetical protein|nr:hypothetical protein [Gemmatimonadaceae bacterium]